VQGMQLLSVRKLAAFLRVRSLVSPQNGYHFGRVFLS